MGLIPATHHKPDRKAFLSFAAPGKEVFPLKRKKRRERNSMQSHATYNVTTLGRKSTLNKNDPERKKAAILRTQRGRSKTEYIPVGMLCALALDPCQDFPEKLNTRQHKNIAAIRGSTVG